MKNKTTVELSPIQKANLILELHGLEADPVICAQETEVDKICRLYLMRCGNPVNLCFNDFMVIERMKAAGICMVDIFHYWPRENVKTVLAKKAKGAMGSLGKKLLELSK